MIFDILTLLGVGHLLIPTQEVQRCRHYQMSPELAALNKHSSDSALFGIIIMTHESAEGSGDEYRVAKLGDKSRIGLQENSPARLIFTMGDLRIFGLLEILMSEFYAKKFCRFLSLFSFSQRFSNIVILRMSDMVPESKFLFYGFNMP